jgi:D-alanine-D-alanine ligase
MHTVVGVLRGGPSSEYDVSLKSGASVLGALDRDKYEPRDLFIDRSGQWHLHGAPVVPEAALRGVDVAFNVIHGQYGEDGRLHDILDSFSVPYTGADATASQLAFDKARAKQAVKKLGIRTPRALLLTAEEVNGDMEKLAFDIFRSFPHPAIVKPAIGGSSVGMSLVDNFHVLAWALGKAFAVSPRVMVEEYIRGREATVGVIDDFRGEKAYALMPVEIIPPRERPFFDYDAKYSGQTIERVPGNFTAAEKDELSQAARAAHEALGQTHYSRSDFIVSRRGIFFLETNSAAAVGMTGESLFPKALAAVGSSLGQFADHVLTLAQGGKRKLHTA